MSRIRRGIIIAAFAALVSSGAAVAGAAPPDEGRAPLGSLHLLAGFDVAGWIADLWESAVGGGTAAGLPAPPTTNASRPPEEPPPDGGPIIEPVVFGEPARD
jgi:hypothetical protein